LDENLATSPAVNRAFLNPFNARVGEFNQGRQQCKFKFLSSFPTAVWLPASRLQLCMTGNGED
jgi:hypothetical protein